MPLRCERDLPDSWFAWLRRADACVVADVPCSTARVCDSSTFLSELILGAFTICPSMRENESCESQEFKHFLFER